MSDKVKDLNNQSITVTIEGTDFTFDVTREAYNTFINSVSGKTVNAMVNFLTSTVVQDHQDAFLKLIKSTPGVETDVFGIVFDAYTPDLDIQIKKPKK